MVNTTRSEITVYSFFRVSIDFAAVTGPPQLHYKSADSADAIRSFGRNCSPSFLTRPAVRLTGIATRNAGSRDLAESYDSSDFHQNSLMAAYREHITVSGMLGIAYAFAAVFALGFSVTQSIVAAILTWIAGMLPDMDSESGRPVRELFGVTAALVPLLLLQHANHLGISDDRAILFSLLLYGGVRYGGAATLGKLTVHRGMFHSIPALIIAAEVTFLCYHNPEVRVRLLMAFGVAIGFLSHLILDEMYSVSWDGTRIKLKKSAGSAMKFFGKKQLPNAIALGMVMFLSYACLSSLGIIRDPQTEPAPEVLEISSELEDAPEFRMADEPKPTRLR